MLAQFGACRSVSGDYAFKPCCQSVAMTSKDPDELNRLRLLAIREKEPARLTTLVEDLNAFPGHSEQARKPQALL